MRMTADATCLLVVDVQERLLPVMADKAAVEKNVQILLQAARRMNVPILASEQYPKGLGPTVPSVRGLLNDDEVIEKMAFSCMGEEGFVSRFSELGRRRVVLCGIESHVCVLQTALDLLDLGVDVIVIADAVSSRTPENKALGLERLRAAGAQVASVEMAVFEWLERAGTPEFKELSGLIK